MIRRGLVVGVSLLTLLVAATAHAATVTVGSPLTASFTVVSGPPATLADTQLPEVGANVTSPVNGVIVRWRVFDASGGPFKLRVLTPGSGGKYTGAGTSAPETTTGLGLQTFSADLPIKAGQTIGIDTSNGNTIGSASGTGSAVAIWDPPLPDGTTESSSSGLPNELAFNADVQLPPGLTGISPSSGPIAGGTTVTIIGHDFTGATAVTLGGANATLFAVSSDTLITAVAPAAPTPGAVDVRVTTAAGQTAIVPGDKFTYTALPLGPGPAVCKVPKVTGKKLKTAKHKLRHADCKLGKVKGHGKKVRGQHPKAGSLLAPGARVSLNLGF